VRLRCSVYGRLPLRRRPQPDMPSPFARLLLAVIAALALAIGVPAGAFALDAEPGQVVVKFEPGSTAHAAQAGGTAPKVLKVASVRDALKGLRSRSDVAYAVPNVVAHASQTGPGYVPNDPGRDNRSGGWQDVQWNFTGPAGVNAPQAWANLIADGRPGGRGVTVAVLDTGVAYGNRPPYAISPDFRRSQFLRGFDFVDRDAYPFDRNGHGTHVAGTLAEATDNGIGLTGLAYGVRLLPVRVLDAAGEGNASDIAAGIRYATRRGAKIINLSLEFDTDVTAGDIPQILEAVAYARARGSLVVAASGNEGRARVAYPARASGVLSVGATTEHACLSEFSNGGNGLDIVAPGGGVDAPLAGDPNCRPGDAAGRNISQVTLLGRAVDRFGVPSSYEGTSMAVPHVAATAALVVASGVLGSNPSPARIEHRLETTTRDLGAKGYDTKYGWGLVDAAAATAPTGTGTGGAGATPVTPVKP
jgi:serine protease